MTPGERTAAAVLLVVAMAGASPYALGWNDGSRLATVESLVDHGTWAIDDSIFVGPPTPDKTWPYPPWGEGLGRGTLDKLLIDGRYYSDKSPVPALPLAGLYAALRACGLPAAAESPRWFCWALCAVPMGLAFVIAVGCVWRLGEPLGLPSGQRLLLAVSFAFATMAWAYSRSLNNHLLLLAVTAALWLDLAWLSTGQSAATAGRMLRLGALAGLAYTIDLGAGPPIAALAFLLAATRTRSWRLAALFVAAGAPFFTLHHGITYALAGTWKPANAVPEHLAWVGSPHTPDVMSGVWAHASPAAFASYALELLAGKRGFLLHNLPLLVVILGLPTLALGRFRERAEVRTALGMAVVVWLVYSLGSSNRGGACVSVRWFLPLLAPGFFLLAVLLRERPRLGRDLIVATVGGAVLGAGMAWTGPWTPRLVPGFWPVVAATVAALVGRRLRRRSSAGSAAGSRSRGPDTPHPGTAGCPAAA